MKKLTKKDKETIKLALFLAIDHEVSYLDSLGDPSHSKDEKWAKELERWIKRTKQNITNFKRLYNLFTE